MKQDIDFVLEGWEYKPGMVQARLVQASAQTGHGGGRQVIQMRVDLGILQLETTGRPDGTRPHNHSSYLGYLREQARQAEKAENKFSLTDEQCQEADREFVQFYHRRICWLALRHYPKAIADADHTLAFMDFLKRFSPSEEYTQAHEQYRGFVLFQRTQAAAAQQAENERPEAAIDEVRRGLDEMRGFFGAHGLLDQMDEDGMVQHLRRIEERLRQEYGITSTLREELDAAVAAEDYERAAQLRDELKRRP
ncbi:MAG TPA: UvrB/UvrC motif-containing protein [Gemmataceae bacterium]|nr:UvrB/UvrC motif-containing protein [Gemmataceae bacterium]